AAEGGAIYDTPGGLAPAFDAGLAGVAFPNENTAGHDFGTAAAVVDRIDYDQLRSLTKDA
ncbi:MAG: haloacid dehalogenase, partial [Jatrophihabitans sp.]